MTDDDRRRLINQQRPTAEDDAKSENIIQHTDVVLVNAGYNDLFCLFQDDV